MIQNYNDFIPNLLQSGFSMSGGNHEGIYSIIPWSWNEEPPYETSVRWHTGEPDTDPWEWRMRVLNEREDIAYAKLFFKKGGYITKEWYPYFLAVRRQGRSFEEEYSDGTISHFAKQIYDIVTLYGSLPLHAIKEIGGFSREDASRFDRALTELQMKMYLTMCGRQQKVSRKGEEYGWSSTVFCTVESYFGEELIDKADKISVQEAVEQITNKIYQLNSAAEEKKMARFIYGK